MITLIKTELAGLREQLSATTPPCENGYKRHSFVDDIDRLICGRCKFDRGTYRRPTKKDKREIEARLDHLEWILEGLK